MFELVDRLETEVKKRKLTFNRIERELGLGNGTIKRWNGQSPRLDKLAAVAQRLDVSLDYLVFGTLRTDCTPGGEPEIDLEAVKQKQGLTCDGSPLEDEEADLIAMYRLLPIYEQEDFFDLVYFKYKKHVEKKEASIYSTYFDGSSSNKQSGPAIGREARDGTA